MGINYILDKAELENRLKELASTPNVELPYGAMCYDIFNIIDTEIEYTCPECNTVSYCSRHGVQALRIIREYFTALLNAGYDFILYEPEYCKKCDVKNDNPKKLYTLMIRFDPADDYHIVKTNDRYDFECLFSFLTGEKHYHGLHDDELLYDHINTISKMTGLGVDTVIEWQKTYVIKEGRL